MRITVNEQEYWVHFECVNNVARIAIMRTLNQPELRGRMMVTSGSGKSRFDRIGGEGPLKAAVELIYARLTIMPSTAHYFKGVRMEGVKRHMVLLLASILGSPQHRYDGPPLRAAHQNLHIPEDDYWLVVGVIVDVLAQLGVDADTVGHIALTLYGVKADIIDPDAIRV